MAYEEALQGISLPSSADYTAAANIYNIVKVTSTGTVVKTSVLGEASLGVLQNNPKAGDPAKVGFGGVSKVKTGGAITAGAQVTTSAAGLGVAAAVGNKIIGTALATAASGDIIPVLLAPPGTAAF